MTIIDRPPSNPRPRSAGGFTLIEMMTVVAIIAVLVALVGGAGVAVIRARQESVTKNLLITLDRALDEYMTINSAPPPYRPTDWDKVPGDGYLILDVAKYRGENHPSRPDASVFIRKALGTGEVDSIIQGISEQFLVTTPNGSTGVIDQGEPNDDLTPSVIDFWGVVVWPEDENGDRWDITRQQLIYYVHPDNPLAQDLYGQCINRRPYFMSAGRDLKYGLGSDFGASSEREEVEAALDDNIYSYPVGPANLEDDFWNWRRY